MLYGTEFWSTVQIQMDAQKLNISLVATQIDESHTKLVFPCLGNVFNWLWFYIKDRSILPAKIGGEMKPGSLDD
jgi:hypothetical protein